VVSTSDPVGRSVMKLYLASGLVVAILMMLVGLAMRMSQAQWLSMPPEIFYELLTLHGAGMIIALLICAMGGLWFLMRRRITLSAPLAVAAWALIILGVVGVVISAVFGNYAGLYTFLYPLPFMGNWHGWATGVFLIGMMLINTGWMIWCFQMLGLFFGRMAVYAGRWVGILSGVPKNLLLPVTNHRRPKPFLRWLRAWMGC